MSIDRRSSLETGLYKLLSACKPEAGSSEGCGSQRRSPQVGRRRSFESFSVIFGAVELDILALPSDRSLGSCGWNAARVRVNRSQLFTRSLSSCQYGRSLDLRSRFCLLESISAATSELRHAAKGH